MFTVEADWLLMNLEPIKQGILRFYIWIWTFSWLNVEACLGFQNWILWTFALLFWLYCSQEDMAIAAGIPSFLEKSIILQTFGQTSHHVCQTNNSIQIPPFMPPSSINTEWLPEKQHRDIWAYFRGKIELHPKNVSGRIYSRCVPKSDFLFVIETDRASFSNWCLDEWINNKYTQRINCVDELARHETMWTTNMEKS